LAGLDVGTGNKFCLLENDQTDTGARSAFYSVGKSVYLHGLAGEGEVEGSESDK
jgi:hypothetical protein